MPKWMQEIKNRRQILKDLKEQYPKGTRIELVKMDDPQAPPIGTFGTVIGVDDTGSLLVNWDNGSGLNVIWGVDVVRKVAQGFMSSDLISRQAAIDDIKAVYEWHDTVTEGRILDHLRRLPSAEPEQRWIPCSERLPEPRIDVWCNSDMGQMVGYYEENVETWYGRDYLELMVTAWMPLPEPYKGGEQDG